AYLRTFLARMKSLSRSASSQIQGGGKPFSAIAEDPVEVSANAGPKFTGATFERILCQVGPDAATDSTTDDNQEECPCTYDGKAEGSSQLPCSWGVRGRWACRKPTGPAAAVQRRPAPRTRDRRRSSILDRKST